MVDEAESECLGDGVCAGACVELEVYVVEV
jgi:hypothetical protein